MDKPISVLLSGWPEAFEVQNEDLSIEEIYGYSENELTAERSYLLEDPDRWPEFFNPLDADT